MLAFMEWLLLTACMVHASEAGYVLQLELRSFSNPGHSLANGECCDEATTQPTLCIGECDNAFVFCWKNYNSMSTSIAANNCISRGSTSVYYNRDYINFPIGSLHSNAVTHRNPITMTGDIWPGGIQMFIRVVDIDNASVRTLVDHFRLQEHLTPPASTPFKTYSGLRNNTTLVARFNVTCTENFYRPSCSTFCASQNDTWLGHYECAVNGEKVCRPGYTDPTSNCTKCATARGCSPQNGYCNNPYECICHVGYGGDLCRQDLDVCGHTKPCVRGTCSNTGPDTYQCECPEGYYGDNCQWYVVLGVDPCMTTPCKNGATCLNVEAFEYTCVCVDGYTGMNCENDSDMCRHTKPCKHNATCLNTGPNAYECHCREGFYGRQCKLNTTSNDSNSFNLPVPAIAGSVVGFIAVFLSLLVCVMIYIGKKKGHFSRRNKQPLNIYTDVSQSNNPSVVTTSNHHTPDHESNQISDNRAEQQSRNQIYTDTDHYYSSADLVRHDASVHYYSNSDVLTGVHHHYQAVDQQSRNPDNPYARREPCYSVSNTIEQVVRSPERLSQAVATENTPRAREEDYSEPIDSTNITKQPPVYHILEGTNITNRGTIFSSPPPVYQVLEQPPLVTSPSDAAYDEAKTPAARGHSVPSPPDYDSIDDYAEPTV